MVTSPPPPGGGVGVSGVEELSDGSGGGSGVGSSEGAGVISLLEDSEPELELSEPELSEPLEVGSSEETPEEGSSEGPGESVGPSDGGGETVGASEALGEAKGDTAGPAIWSEPPLQVPGRLLPSYQP